MLSGEKLENGADGEGFKALGLPADLEAKTYAKFDSMVNEGRIFYQNTGFELYSHNGFQVGFAFISIFGKKQKKNNLDLSLNPCRFP